MTTCIGLLSIVLDQIALEGEQGCSIPRLWELVRVELECRSVIEQGVVVTSDGDTQRPDTQQKAWLWKQLVQCSSSESASFRWLTGPPGLDTSVELDVNDLPHDISGVHPNVHVQASRDMWFTAIRVPKHRRDCITDEQRAALEVLGRLRYNGSENAALRTLLNLGDSRAGHHFFRPLLDYIFKTRAQELPRGQGTGRSVIMMYLRRFAVDAMRYGELANGDVLFPEPIAEHTSRLLESCESGRAPAFPILKEAMRPQASKCKQDNAEKKSFRSMVRHSMVAAGVVSMPGKAFALRQAFRLQWPLEPPVQLFRDPRTGSGVALEEGIFSSALRLIRESGTNGITSSDVAMLLAVSRKEFSFVMSALQSMNVVVGVARTVNKQRTIMWRVPDAMPSGLEDAHYQNPAAAASGDGDSDRARAPSADVLERTRLIEEVLGRRLVLALPDAIAICTFPGRVAPDRRTVLRLARRMEREQQLHLITRHTPTGKDHIFLHPSLEGNVKHPVVRAFLKQYNEPKLSVALIKEDHDRDSEGHTAQASPSSFATNGDPTEEAGARTVLVPRATLARIIHAYVWGYAFDREGNDARWLHWELLLPSLFPPQHSDSTPEPTKHVPDDFQPDAQSSPIRVDDVFDNIPVVLAKTLFACVPLNARSTHMGDLRQHKCYIHARSQFFDTLCALHTWSCINMQPLADLVAPGSQADAQPFLIAKRSFVVPKHVSLTPGLREDASAFASAAKHYFALQSCLDVSRWWNLVEVYVCKKSDTVSLRTDPSRLMSRYGWLPRDFGIAASFSRSLALQAKKMLANKALDVESVLQASSILPNLSPLQVWIYGREIRWKGTRIYRPSRRPRARRLFCSPDQIQAFVNAVTLYLRHLQSRNQYKPVDEWKKNKEWKRVASLLQGSMRIYMSSIWKRCNGKNLLAAADLQAPFLTLDDPAGVHFHPLPTTVSDTHTSPSPTAFWTKCLLISSALYPKLSSAPLNAVNKDIMSGIKLALQGREVLRSAHGSAEVLTKWVTLLRNPVVSIPSRDGIVDYVNGLRKRLQAARAQQGFGDALREEEMKARREGFTDLHPFVGSGMCVRCDDDESSLDAQAGLELLQERGLVDVQVGHRFVVSDGTLLSMQPSSSTTYHSSSAPLLPPQPDLGTLPPPHLAPGLQSPLPPVTPTPVQLVNVCDPVANVHGSHPHHHHHQQQQQEQQLRHHHPHLHPVPELQADVQPIGNSLSVGSVSCDSGTWIIDTGLGDAAEDVGAWLPPAQALCIHDRMLTPASVLAQRCQSWPEAVNRMRLVEQVPERMHASSARKRMRTSGSVVGSGSVSMQLAREWYERIRQSHKVPLVWDPRRARLRGDRNVDAVEAALQSLVECGLIAQVFCPTHWRAWVTMDVFVREASVVVNHAESASPLTTASSAIGANGPSDGGPSHDRRAISIFVDANGRYRSEMWCDFRTMVFSRVARHGTIMATSLAEELPNVDQCYIRAALDELELLGVVQVSHGHFNQPPLDTLNASIDPGNDWEQLRVDRTGLYLRPSATRASPTPPHAQRANE